MEDLTNWNNSNKTKFSGFLREKNKKKVQAAW